MLPNTRIVISPTGDSRIEGLEKTDQCYKLSELGKQAGKVTKYNTKDHTPVYQSVHQKGV